MPKKSKPDTEVPEKTNDSKKRKKLRIFSLSDDATLLGTMTQILLSHLRLESDDGSHLDPLAIKSHHHMIESIAKEIHGIVINVDKDLAIARTELLMETLSNHLESVPARELATTMNNIRII